MGLLDKIKGLFSNSKETDNEELNASQSQSAEGATDDKEPKDSKESQDATASPTKLRMRERIAQHQANVQAANEKKAARAATLAAAKEKLAAARAAQQAKEEAQKNLKETIEKAKNEEVDEGVKRLNERIQMERRFCSQPKEHRIRVTKDTPLTLGDFIEKIYEIPAENISQMYVVTDDLEGKDVRAVKKPAQYDMLSDLLTITDNDCQPKGKGRNVMLNVLLDDGVFERMSIHMYCDGTFGENPQVLIKLSLMNVKTNNEVEWDFAYLTFDMTLPEGLLQEVDLIKKSAAEHYRKGTELNQWEKEILHIPDVSVEKDKADAMIKQARFGDAISVLTRVYKFIKPLLLHQEVKDGVLEYAKHLCMNLAICYTQLGLYDMALYWAELSYSFKKDDIKLLAVASLNAKDIRVLQLFKLKDPKQLASNIACSPYIEPYKMGVVLNKCFHVIPSELSRMVLVLDDDPSKTQTIEGIENIWTFDFIDVMRKRDSMTAYISYRSERDQQECLEAVRKANAEAKVKAEEEKVKAEQEADTEGAEGKKAIVAASSKRTSIYQFVDLSKDRIDNEIIIHFSKRKKSRQEFVNMEVMVPEFRHSDNNNNGNPLVKDFLFYTKQYFTMEEFEETRKEAMEKAQKEDEDLTADEQYANGELIDARFNMIMGRASGDNKAWGDALYYLYKAQQLMAYEYLSGNEDGNAAELIQELSYRLGYIFSQNRLYEQGLGFLMRNRRLLVSKYQHELVNVLCNGHDYRAMDYIKNMMDDIHSVIGPDEYPDKTTQAFLTFLQRRLAYLMIERGQLKNAQKLLEGMLNEDKRTHDFAEFELQYLHEMFSLEQIEKTAEKETEEALEEATKEDGNKETKDQPEKEHTVEEGNIVVNVDGVEEDLDNPFDLT